MPTVTVTMMKTMMTSVVTIVMLKTTWMMRMPMTPRSQRPHARPYARKTTERTSTAPLTNSDILEPRTSLSRNPHTVADSRRLLRG